MKCPKHQTEVVAICERAEDVKAKFCDAVVGRLVVTVSKCPEFGCGYTVESDENGVMIRDSKERT